MNKTISLLRVFSMLYIVLYHCVCYYGIWKFFPDNETYEYIEWWRGGANFALDVFVFISGYLFAYLYLYKGKYRDRKAFIKNKVLRILIPYLVWSSIGLLMFPSPAPIQNIFCGVQHLWFLLMLFGVFFVIIFGVESFVNLSQLKQMGGVALITTGGALLSIVSANIINIFCWEMILRYLPAFLIGVLLAQRRWHERLNGLNPIVFSLIMLLSVLLTIFFIFSEKLPFGTIYRKYPVYITLVFLYSALCRKELHLPAFVLSLDRCSMGIYIIHHLLIWIFLFYCSQAQQLMNEYYILAPMVMFVSIFIASWGITHLMLKNKYTAKIIGT